MDYLNEGHSMASSELTQQLDLVRKVAHSQLANFVLRHQDRAGQLQSAMGSWSNDCVNQPR